MEDKIENKNGMDSALADGWDKSGIRCWAAHTFDSLGFVENATEHICLVSRTFNDGSVKNVEFRRYVNRYGDERFVMFSVDDGMDSQFIGRKMSVNITDGDFFRRFCDEMLEFGEITENCHDILVGAVTPPEILELDELP